MGGEQQVQMFVHIHYHEQLDSLLLGLNANFSNYLHCCLFKYMLHFCFTCWLFDLCVLLWWLDHSSYFIKL